MKRVPNRRRWGILLIGGLLLGLAMGGTTTLRAQSKPTIAIFPFLVERGEDPAREAVCPLCGGAYRRGSIQAGSGNKLTRLLYEKIGVLGIFEVTPAKKVEEGLSSIPWKEWETRPLSMGLKLAKELEANFLLFGYLYRFEERVGASIGVEKPASVGFDLHLQRVRDGRIVWTAKFDETQRPLSENLLRLGAFLRRGASWAKAEELASVGMDEALRTLPSLEELEGRR